MKNFLLNLPNELIISIILTICLIIFYCKIFFLLKKTNPLDKPKGLLSIIEIIITKFDEFINKNINNKNENFFLLIFNSYLIVVCNYIFFSSLISILGMSNPLTNVNITLALSFCTFIFINIAGIKSLKWKYIKKFFQPFFIFFPSNILSLLSRLLSLGLRLFFSTFAGWLLINFCYQGLWHFLTKTMLFSSLIMPFLHIYFDIFASIIQIFIFMFLSILFVDQEIIENKK